MMLTEEWIHKICCAVKLICQDLFFHVP